mgnify:CR=1 FL=1
MRVTEIQYDTERPFFISSKQTETRFLLPGF